MILSPLLFLFGFVVAQAADSKAPQVMERGRSSALPAPPIGRSSVMGGSIAKVDSVRDSFELNVPGTPPVRIWYDERTQFFQDGTPSSILDLKPSEHASIETRLDDSAIFAVRIHILSNPPEGEFRGQVVSYDPSSMELRLRVADQPKLVTLTVPPGTLVSRPDDIATGAGSTVHVMNGALVEVSFKSDTKGHGVATHIEMFAVPGEISVIQGRLSALDLRVGRMTIHSQTNAIPTDVYFDRSHFPAGNDLHVNISIQVRVRFDGNHFVAIELMPE